MKSGQDATPGRMVLDTGSPVAEPVEPRTRVDNGGQAKIPSTPETTVDVEESPVRLESEEFGANLDASLKKAQESLQHRQQAQTLRDRAQSVFAQSESIMEEAIRSVEAAGVAFGAGVSDSTANSDAVIQAQGMGESLRSRLRKSQSTYQDVLRQAHGPKELATQDLAAALDSLNFELINVEHELAESARASAMADSAKESAMQDLLSVHTMWNGFASRSQEPLTQPDPRSPRDALPETVDQANQASSPTAKYAVESSAEAVNQIENPRESLTEASSGVPGQDSEHADALSGSALPLSDAESASEALHRELAGLMAMPDEKGTKFRNGDSNGTKPPAPVTAAPEPMGTSAVRPVSPSGELARTYTGRVYLMFDASLAREDLESVWDAVEEAAGPGVIIDTRLVSRDEGVQVTLDLDGTTLDVAAFLRRLRGAELAAITDDRLKVAWTAAV
ncbi:MAG: hypothetical protein BZY87_04140 [SAR202 cluster bacterium Io17-Chloro-G6]|nr:MAG: hypothetical protein BZY87_04140 [SAR202 cluster bacterium Io17-Chloro-G6]